MLTNRDYYSWSQHELWKLSKTAFYKRYFLGEKSYSGGAQTKGTELANVLDGTMDIGHVNDPMIFEVVGLIQKLDIQEYKLEYEIQGNKMLGFMDSCSIMADEFLEYKTGVEPWDQHRVDTHGQLGFYALGLWINSGRLVVPSCKLVWIETEKVDVLNEDGTFKYATRLYTGKVETFERKFTVSDLVKIEKDIIETLKDIADFEYVEAEIKDDIVKEYIELKKSIEDNTGRMNAIKELIKIDVEIQNVSYASSESGKFTLASRKTKTYSKSLIEIKKEYAKKIKDLENYEVKNNLVTYTQGSSYLTFKEF